jgi:excisionase family DNA binding protein
MDKKQAAEFLGCSPRQLERYVKENRIGVTMQPGRTRPTPDFDEGELRRFKEALERPVHRPAVERMEAAQGVPTQGDGVLSLLSQPSQLEALARLMQAMNEHNAVNAPKASPTAQDVAAKLMLTIDEAATFAGTSRGAIERAIRADELTVHSGFGRGYRLKRADLEQWIETL